MKTPKELAKAAIIFSITHQIVALSKGYFDHPDTVAKIYAACREVEREVTKRMEQIRSTRNGNTTTTTPKDKSTG